MAIETLGIGMRAFLGGAIAKYIWINPELNRSGLKTLSQGGLWGIALQITALVIGARIARIIPKPGTSFLEKKSQAENRTTLVHFGTVIACFSASVVIGQRLGIKTTYREAGITALLSTVGLILAAMPFIPKRT
jgi:hypothetical protein